MKMKQKNQGIMKHEVDKNFPKLLSTFKGYTEARKKEIPLVKIDKLYRSFLTIRGYKRVLNGVNLSIYEGEHIALLGANGAGKTTLLEILAGASTPSSGKIYYNYAFDRSPQESIGIQFQDATCPAGLKVIDVIRFQNEINKVMLPNDKLTAMIEEFKLTNLLKSKASKLSGGQQQRLNVFLSLINNPKILFLDELSTALDVSMQFFLMDYIIKYAKANNTTIILSSHNVKEIVELTDRVVILKKGKIAFDAPMSNVLKHFKDFEYFIDNYLKI